jgi:hypothetical protein
VTYSDSVRREAVTETIRGPANSPRITPEAPKAFHFNFRLGANMSDIMPEDKWYLSEEGMLAAEKAYGSVNPRKKDAAMTDSEKLQLICRYLNAVNYRHGDAPCTKMCLDMTVQDIRDIISGNKTTP